MLKFAICDDEPQMVQQLTEALTQYLKETQIAAFSVSRFSGGAALLDSGGGFDVVFLDIQMEQPDGMETARLLRRRGDRSLLIFVTVLKESVFDAFQVEAFDYLVKPLDSARFRRIMDRALRSLEEKAAETILIPQGAGWQVVPLTDILYVEVLGRKLYLHKTDGTILDYYGRLENWEHRLGSRFFKCHRSYLVNLSHVRGCRGGQVLLPQGQAIPVSRLRERELTQAMLRHMEKGDC